MKVGIVHTAYLQKGGEDVVVEQEYKLLKNHNIPVAILYFRNATGKLEQFRNYLSSAFNIGSYFTISKWIRQERPDVIHVHNWHYQASPAVFLAAKIRGIPVVHTLHNYRLLCPSGTLVHHNKLFLDSLKSAFPWCAIKEKVYRDSYILTFLLAITVWLNKIFGTWKHINKFIVFTDTAKEIFKASRFHFTDSQFAVKPNFIQFIPSPGEFEQRQRHFLFIGRLSEEKGIHVLLQAFAKIDHEISIIGTGPLVSMVNEYAEKHANIKYLGFQDPHFILAELKKCSAFVFPSIGYEGNPLTIIESFACGTPVIASARGAMKSMITDKFNGLYVQPNNADDLACKVLEWAEMAPANQRVYCCNARKTYETVYTPEKNFEQLISIYKSLWDEQN